MLQGKKILLAITGSIAAYKSLVLIRLLVKKGAEVKVIMTHSATTFITPLSCSVLSRHTVYTDFVDQKQDWNDHVHLGLWADLMIIAPASANTIAKMAHGLCDNILLATYLSAKCPVAIAPAMDLDMWKHPATLHNIETVKGFQNLLIPVAHGELASGLVGEGRMAEPEDILVFVEDFFQKKQLLKGKKILVNAGPTYEAIDPVRFIGNHSTGKMGIALAKQASALGAEVTLVIGPTQENLDLPFTVHKIRSSDELFDKCTELFPNMDWAICSAAVADYKPVTVAQEKIKKSEEGLTLELVKTKDTLHALGKMKKDDQILVGFALETQDAIQYGKKKLVNKNLDWVIINTPTATTGFGHDTNQILLLNKKNQDFQSALDTKENIATWIFDKILSVN